jgi:hypothetical protein
MLPGIVALHPAIAPWGMSNWWLAFGLSAILKRTNLRRSLSPLHGIIAATENNRTLQDLMQQWQDLAQESFFNMVNAPDGDFEAIAHLSNTLNNPDSLQMMVEILSRQQFLQPLED